MADEPSAATKPEEVASETQPEKTKVNITVTGVTVTTEDAAKTEHTTDASKTESATDAPKTEPTTDAAESTPAETLKRKADDDNTADNWRERRAADQDKDGKRANTRGNAPGNNGARKNYSANVKSDFSTLPESSDPDEIRKQVEFYFSDSNLLTDKFLLSKVGGSANNAVPLKVVHSFKRMRHFQPYTAVLAALRESSVLDVTADEQVVRKQALPAAAAHDATDNVQLFEDATRSRSIYAKGFGAEDATTQVDIEAFFAPYGPVNAIRLRRSYPEKVFKGSVFVEFDADATAKAFLELENKPKWKDAQELVVMSKEEYVRGKAEDVKAGRIKGNSGRGGRGRGDGGNRDRRDGGRGGRGNGRGGDRGRGGGRGRGGRGGRGGGRDRNEERSRQAGEDKPAESKADGYVVDRSLFLAFAWSCVG